MGDKYIGKGLTGLQNLGNTCFINSAIQCLFNVGELNTFMDKIDISKKVNNKPDSILLLEWNNLREMVFKENCIISPGRFVNTVRKIASVKDKDIFTGVSQNDLPEFLLFIIDCFHNSLSREVIMTVDGVVKTEKDKVAKACYNMMKNMYQKEFSEILTNFYGIHVSLLYSENNNTLLSCKPEPFCLIDLPIPQNNKNPSIYDCLDLYVLPEFLSDDNAWYNEKTKTKENVNKCINFWSFPEILIISFKKFNNFNKKITNTISTPITNLDLSKYILGYDKESFKYDLFGICNHSGGCLGGHFFDLLF